MVNKEKLKIFLSGNIFIAMLFALIAIVNLYTSIDSLLEISLITNINQYLMHFMRWQSLPSAFIS